MKLNELYNRLYAEVVNRGDYDDPFLKDVLALISISKGMQKGLATYERTVGIKDKALKTLTDAHRRLKLDYTWLHAVNTKLFNQQYVEAERDVPFHRYITDYLFAHGFLKNDGTVRNIP